MTAQQVIDCCPWRLTSPRPLTRHEWDVVFYTVREQIEASHRARGLGFSMDAWRDANALVTAIRTQTACPNWTTSIFGPSPAVATFAYGCLASWWGLLSATDAARALADIRTGLLCAPSPPWVTCPAAQRDLAFGPSSKSEYGRQKTHPPAAGSPPPLSLCAQVRDRIEYVPMSGETMAPILEQLGLDAETMAMIDKTKPFILGIQSRPMPKVAPFPPLPADATPIDYTRRLIEAVVIINAPGDGTDLTPMVHSGQIDPALLLQLIQRLMPNLLSDWMEQIPGLITDLLPQLQLELPGWETLLDDLSDLFAKGINERLRNPQTGNTGNDLVDNPPTALGATTIETKATIFIVAAAIVGVGAFVMMDYFATRG